MGDVDLVDLENALWKAFLDRHLAEMSAQRWVDGTFTAGWESAIEEIQTRIADFDSFVARAAGHGG